MFTGIVEELGRVVAVEVTAPGAVRLSVDGPLVTSDAVPGGSIAVSGVCLTIVELDGSTFSADVMAETLHRTGLGDLRPGDPVNLERALRGDARLDGHIVQGHVDGVGHLLHRVPGERWEVLRVSVPADLARYVAMKGSVAVDGVSLTVSGLGDDGRADVGGAGPIDWFEVSLIPTTLARTTLGRLVPAQRVNLEVDVIAKYVERLLAARSVPDAASTPRTTAPERTPS